MYNDLARGKGERLKSEVPMNGEEQFQRGRETVAAISGEIVLPAS